MTDEQGPCRWIPEAEVAELYLAALGKKQCERIHEAALQVLDRTGCVFEHQGALDLFRKAGAKVEGQIVRLPKKLVDWSLDTVPSTFVLHDQEGHPVSRVGRRVTLFGTGSDCLNILDHRTGARRPPSLKDLAELVTLCERLSNIDFVMSMVIPNDVATEKTDAAQMETMMSYSKKPIVNVSFSAAGTAKILDMAASVAGGERNLKEKPFLVHYMQPVRALRHNEDTVEKLLITARKGLPCLYHVSAIMGLSGPITAAGYQVMGCAGQLAALVLAQLATEGTPFVVRGGRIVEADMKTMISTFANPGNRVFSADMAHYYDLPSFGTGGVSDSKLADWQAVAEASLTLMADALAGANLIHDVGYIESGLTYSAEMLVLCDEIISWIRQFKKGAPVDADALAVDLIHELGFNGDFLSTDHTFRHFRQQWEPTLFDRHNHTGWVDRGELDTTARTRQRIAGLLEEPPASRLSTADLRGIARIRDR